MAELVPNPDGCKRFEPNAFKKEKCKNCGRPWFEHKGVIDDKILQGYTAQLQKVAADKAKTEEETRHKAKAKQDAKKKQTQAVEDEWLFDGGGDKVAGAVGADESDDDDMGFRMFTPDVQQQTRPAQQSNTTFKVKNLIDFEESNQELPPASPRMPMESDTNGKQSASSAAPPVATSPRGANIGNPAMNPMGVAQPPSSRADAKLVALQSEIQDLKQMLADANAEKSIQVEIHQDEVAEKQQLIEDLTRRSVESEATVQELRRQVEDQAKLQQAQSQQAAAPQDSGAAEAERWQAEAARLHAQVEDLNRRADAHAAAVQALEAAKSTAETEAAAAKAEAAAAREAAEKAQQAEQESRRSAVQVRSPVSPSGDGHAEAHAVAQQMGRHAAQALREIRLNAEMQLAWLSKRRLMDGQQLASETTAPSKEP